MQGRPRPHPTSRQEEALSGRGTHGRGVPASGKGRREGGVCSL